MCRITTWTSIERGEANIAFLPLFLYTYHIVQQRGEGRREGKEKQRQKTRQTIIVLFLHVLYIPLFQYTNTYCCSLCKQHVLKDIVFLMRIPCSLYVALIRTPIIRTSVLLPKLRNFSSWALLSNNEAPAH